MSEAPFKYRRLPGRGRRTRGPLSVMAARCSLWIGPDHVLSLDRIWVNEEYKRFYFRDIQSITIEETRTATLWNYILGVIAICIELLFWAISRNSANLVFGGIVSGIFLLFVVINLFRGPSCICRLRTAVQTEELPSLGRTATAARAMVLLKPLIEQTQGALARDEIGARVAPPIPRPASPDRTRPVTPPNAPSQATRVSSGSIHAALFATLTIDAMFGFLNHVHPVPHLYYLVSSVLLLALTSLTVCAMVGQRDTAVPAALKSLTVFTFAWNLIILFGVFIFGFIARMAYSMQHAGRLPTHIDFLGLAGFYTTSLITDTVELGLGLAGLVMTISYILRRGQESLPAAGPEEPRDTSQLPR